MLCVGYTPNLGMMPYTAESLQMSAWIGAYAGQKSLHRSITAPITVAGSIVTATTTGD